MASILRGLRASSSIAVRRSKTLTAQEILLKLRDFGVLRGNGAKTQGFRFLGILTRWVSDVTCSLLLLVHKKSDPLPGRLSQPGGRFLAVVVLHFTARCSQGRSIERRSHLGKTLDSNSAGRMGSSRLSRVAELPREAKTAQRAKETRGATAETLGLRVSCRGRHPFAGSVRELPIRSGSSSGSS